MEIISIIISVCVILVRVFEIVSKIRKKEVEYSKETDLIMFLILVINRNTTNTIIEKLMFIIAVLIIANLGERIFMKMKKKT